MEVRAMLYEDVVEDIRRIMETPDEELDNYKVMIKRALVDQYRKIKNQK